MPRRSGCLFTVIGVGLAIIRLAALGSLPLAALADRVGRRRVMLGCTALGLAATALAALSPGYWWFVALFALGRPLLAGTNAIQTGWSRPRRPAAATGPRRSPW